MKEQIEIKRRYREVVRVQCDTFLQRFWVAHDFYRCLHGVYLYK